MSSKKADKRWQRETSVQDACIQTIVDYAERSDRDAKRKLSSMNQKLKDIERQMEALEAEINKASR